MIGDEVELQSAELQGGGDDPVPLSTVPVPQPLGGDIVNQAAAIRLGKALFWDVQTGTDGQVACATCHFRAGADNRLFNTLNPGPDNIFASGGVTAAGQTFSPVSIVNDDRVGSQGIARATFVSIASSPTSAVDNCTPVVDPQFGTQRRVTGRNTPTVIGAVFFRDNFWDGRANHIFNGLDPFGNTANATPGGPVSIGNASLASQAFGATLASQAQAQFSRIWGQAIQAYEATLIPVTTGSLPRRTKQRTDQQPTKRLRPLQRQR